LIALIVILLRWDWEFSRESLHTVGFQAILLSFPAALFEDDYGHARRSKLLGFLVLESALLGWCAWRGLRRSRGTDDGRSHSGKSVVRREGITHPRARRCKAWMMLRVIVAFSIVLGLYVGGYVNLVWSRLQGLPLSITFRDRRRLGDRPCFDSHF
jgi:hypothetical protein